MQVLKGFSKYHYSGGMKVDRGSLGHYCNLLDSVKSILLAQWEAALCFMFLSDISLRVRITPVHILQFYRFFQVLIQVLISFLSMISASLVKLNTKDFLHFFSTLLLYFLPVDYTLARMSLLWGWGTEHLLCFSLHCQGQLSGNPDPKHQGEGLEEGGLSLGWGQLGLHPFTQTCCP